MNKNPPKKQKLSLKKLATPKNNLLLAIAITFVLILLFLFWPGDLRQYPLGDKNKLEYIGYEAGGCPSIYFLGFCDSRPYKTLYYATDMTPEEVVGYFRGAKVKYSVEDKGDYISIPLYPLTNPERTLFISYYEEKNITIERLSKKTMKRHYLSLSDNVYDIAKNAL